MARKEILFDSGWTEDCSAEVFRSPSFCRIPFLPCAATARKSSCRKLRGSWMRNGLRRRRLRETRGFGEGISVVGVGGESGVLVGRPCGGD